ncbi:MAG: hypothetical protein KGZ63_14645 [Clostridiales bacterium]|jgi:hypothetical protein|nr:hypothetical protein [Clostridiales bacterium]
MKDKLTKYYTELTPRERFKLVLDALSRDDEDEMNRLAETCPQKTYRMKDAAVTDLVDSSRDVVLVFTILWLDGMRRFLTIWGINQAYKESGQSNNSMSVDDPVKLAEQLYDLSSLLKGIYTGLRHFCEEIEVEPESLLAWYPPVLNDIDLLRDILDSGIPASEEASKLVLTVLRQRWQAKDAH